MNSARVECTRGRVQGHRHEWRARSLRPKTGRSILTRGPSSCELCYRSVFPPAAARLLSVLLRRRGFEALQWVPVEQSPG